MPNRFALVLLLLPVTAFAQFGEKVEVNYLEVPVTVLGRDGAPVRNLTKANFEVYDKGEKRTIESFDAIDFSSVEVMHAVSPLNPASRRNFLLLFDLSYSTPTSIARAQEAARNFVARSVGKRDLVGIGVINVDRGFRLLTAFTTDRTLLAAAIADPANFRAFDPLQIGSTADVIFDATSAGAAGGRTERATDPGGEVVADLKRAVQAADDSYRRTRVTKQVDSLGDIARSLQKLAGRKHIVLLSEGFDPRLVQGRMVGDSAEQTEENQAVSIGEVWKVDSDKRFGHAGAQRSIQLMAEQFARADVVLHAVDIQGVRMQQDVRGGAKVNSNDGLFLLANATGGEVFRNSNDLSSGFDSLIRQQEVVYVLGFRVPTSGSKPGDFRDLKVKLVNVPGARVSHRDGYYTTGAESNIERSLTTAEIILNDIPASDLDVAAMAAAFPAGEKYAQVPVILEISGPDLIRAAKNNIASTDIFIYAFDEDGLVRDHIFQPMRFDMAKVGDRLNAAGVKFYGTLMLPPGRYALKSLVRVAETDNKTFHRIDVTVPESGDVAVLQPMFFAEAGNWVMVKTEPKQKGKTPYPFVLNGETFIPEARATIREGRQFTVWVWNATPDELSWETAPAAKLVSQTEGTAMTKLVFELGQVPSGARELGVTIRKKGSNDERRVSVPVQFIPRKDAGSPVTPRR
jgi:VWFA-related protein